MTEEQIKKKADKYLKAYTDRSIHITKDRLLQLMIREVFIDGYHEGFKDCAKSRLNVTTISDCPIKDEWHNLRKDPTDLPKDKEYVFVYTDLNNYYVAEKVDNHFISKGWEFIPMSTVIAWCEIPTFDKEQGKI